MWLQAISLNTQGLPGEYRNWGLMVCLDGMFLVQKIHVPKNSRCPRKPRVFVFDRRWSFHKNKIRDRFFRAGLARQENTWNLLLIQPRMGDHLNPKDPFVCPKNPGLPRSNPVVFGWDFPPSIHPDSSGGVVRILRGISFLGDDKYLVP